MRNKNSLTAPILALTVLALLYLSRYVDSSILEYRENIYLSVIIVQLLIFVLPAIFYIKLKGTGQVLRMNFRPVSPRAFAFIIFAALTLISLMTLIKTVMYVLGVYTGSFTLFGSYIPGGSLTLDAAGIAYLLLAFALLPAIGEELVFRSALLCDYQSSSGSVIAVIVTSLLFSATGFSIAELPMNFAMGALLAVSAIVTRSVLAPFVIRLAYNIFALLTEYNLSTLLRASGNTVPIALICAALFLLFLFLTCSEAERLYSVYAFTRPDDAPNPLVTSTPAAKRYFEAFLSPTLMLCAVMFVIGVFT